jgi:hypothetical protein
LQHLFLLLKYFTFYYIIKITIFCFYIINYLKAGGAKNDGGAKNAGGAKNPGGVKKAGASG